MRNVILKVLFLFYHYYDKGSTKGIAYFSSIMALVGIMAINTLFVLIILGVIDCLPMEENHRWKNYLLVAILYVLPLYFLIGSKCKKTDVLKVKLKKSLRFNYFLLVTYIIFSVALLIAAILLRN